jgi:hypothetical protein
MLADARAKAAARHRHVVSHGHTRAASLHTLRLPQTPAQNKAMFNFGRKEALSWAQEAGFPEALRHEGV